MAVSARDWPNFARSTARGSMFHGNLMTRSVLGSPTRGLTRLSGGRRSAPPSRQTGKRICARATARRQSGEPGRGALAHRIGDRCSSRPPGRGREMASAVSRDAPRNDRRAVAGRAIREGSASAWTCRSSCAPTAFWPSPCCRSLPLLPSCIRRMPRRRSESTASSRPWSSSSGASRAAIRSTPEATTPSRKDEAYPWIEERCWPSS